MINNLLLVNFDDYLNTNNIKRPVVLLNDGHSSRFNFNALKFGIDREIRAFLFPPDSTSVTQMLDQVNSVLHSSYASAKTNISYGSSINREMFMTILGNNWPTWVSRDGIVNAFRKCGISASGLNVDWMQQAKFQAAE